MMQYFIALHGYAQKPGIKHIEFCGPLNELQKMAATASHP